MGLVLDCSVGQRDLAAGANAVPGLDNFGSLLVQQNGGKYRSAVLAGRVFIGATAAAGVDHGATVGTTAAFALYNPLGSGKRLVIMRTRVAYLTGTLGAGALVYCANVVPQAAEVTGTDIVEVNALLGSSIACVGRALTTATLPAAPKILRPLGTVMPITAASAVSPWQIEDDVDGEIIVGEGACLSVQGISAGGSTPRVQIGMTWEEIVVR